MAAPTSDSTVKKHSRHPSSGGRALPRRSTRGPLDIADAPVGSSSTTPSSTLSPGILSPAAPSPSSTPRTRSPRPPNSPLEAGAKDFSYLLRPETYHPLSQLDVPAPFRASPQQPSNSTPLPTLLLTGHFRAAAILAATQLTAPTLDKADHETIFSLFYVRLAALTLCNATALAAQEVKALEDLNSAYYRDDLTGINLVPWELRVLAVRLQGIGFNDPRKWISGYYELAREARAEVASSKEKDAEKTALWETRVKDLGVRVACALVEMDDIIGATRHLSTLKGGDGELDYMKALLWLQIGDIDAARLAISSHNQGAKSVVEALSSMADGDYKAAVQQWKLLSERDAGDEMYAQNLAVSLLYTGKMDEARKILEGLVENGKSFQALTFNLSTIYELCTDKSKNAKMALAEKAAALPESGAGWEKVNTDFKL